MKKMFYLAFPIRDALRHELSWTHYRSLTRVSDPIAREWYMNECIASPKKPFVVKLRRKKNSIASKSRTWPRSRSKYRLFTQRPEPPERKRWYNAAMRKRAERARTMTAQGYTRRRAVFNGKAQRHDWSKFQDDATAFQESFRSEHYIKDGLYKAV